MKTPLPFVAAVAFCALCLSFVGCGKTEADRVEAMDIPLEVKRVLLDFAKTTLPETQKTVNEIVGYSVPIEVDWPSLTIYDKTYTTVERFKRYGCDPIIEGLRAVAKDEAGKKAIAAKLKRIHIGGRTKDIPLEMATTLYLKDGTLFLKQGFDGNGVWDGGRVKECLEKSL